MVDCIHAGELFNTPPLPHAGHRRLLDDTKELLLTIATRLTESLKTLWPTKKQSPTAVVRWMDNTTITALTLHSVHPSEHCCQRPNFIECPFPRRDTRPLLSTSLSDPKHTRTGTQQQQQLQLPRACQSDPRDNHLQQQHRAVLYRNSPMSEQATDRRELWDPSEPLDWECH